MYKATDPLKLMADKHQKTQMTIYHHQVTEKNPIYIKKRSQSSQSRKDVLYTEQQKSAIVLEESVERGGLGG